METFIICALIAAAFIALVFQVKKVAENRLYTNRVIYPTGTKVYCENGHFVGTANKDIRANMVASVRDFDFDPDNVQQQYEPTLCKVCGGNIVKYTYDGSMVLINAQVP